MRSLGTRGLRKGMVEGFEERKGSEMVLDG